MHRVASACCRQLQLSDMLEYRNVSYLFCILVFVIAVPPLYLHTAVAHGRPTVLAARGVSNRMLANGGQFGITVSVAGTGM